MFEQITQDRRWPIKMALSILGLVMCFGASPLTHWLKAPAWFEVMMLANGCIASLFSVVIPKKY